MANQEQLDILKQGVHAWNQWREEHSDIRPDLHDANLFSANLNGANLRGADLSHAELNYADLGHAILSEATLSGANLRDASLNGADLYGVDLDRAIVVATSFGAIDLSVVKNLVHSQGR